MGALWKILFNSPKRNILMIHTEYYADGTPCECDEIHRDYYGSGSVWQEIPCVKGKMHGTIKYYFEAGGVSEELPYANGKKHGTARWFYRSGGVYWEIPYVNDKKHGIRKEYHESGALAAMRMYNHGVSCPMNGCPMENFV